MILSWYKELPSRREVKTPPVGKIDMSLPSVSDMVDLAADIHFSGQVLMGIEESKKQS